MNYYKNNKEQIRANKKNLLKRNVRDKKYYCERCNKAYRDSTELSRHLRSNKHNNIKVRYKCPHTGCGYENKAQYHLTKHLESRKHRGIEI